MVGYELAKSLVLERTNPHVIMLMVDQGMLTMEDWDKAIALAEYYDEMEYRWKESQGTATERAQQFIKDGVLSQNRVWQMREEVIKEEFTESVRSGKTDQKKKDRYAALFSERLSADAIQRANDFPLESIITTRQRKALCPFHNEKTPSLSITKNLYFCFGCGAKGNTIQFIMNTQQLDFVQAVKYINSL